MTSACMQIYTVHTVTDLVTKYELFEHVSLLSRPRDHYIVAVEVYPSPSDRLRHTTRAVFGRDTPAPIQSAVELHDIPTQNKRIYKLQEIPNEFMANSTWTNNLDELIYRIETLEQNHNMVDDIYGNMCQKMFQ